VAESSCFSEMISKGKVSRARCSHMCANTPPLWGPLSSVFLRYNTSGERFPHPFSAPCRPRPRFLYYYLSLFTSELSMRCTDDSAVPSKCTTMLGPSTHGAWYLGSLLTGPHRLQAPSLHTKRNRPPACTARTLASRLTRVPPGGACSAPSRRKTGHPFGGGASPTAWQP
jgi:hypothetical protein